MATRMQQRRGTAAQWTAANPVLAAGEIGFETDTNKFKMGNGSSAWSALQYFANAAELAAIVDGAPNLLNTLNELAQAIGDDPDFVTNIGIDIQNVATDLSTHASDTSMVHGIADTTQLATLTDVQGAISDAGTALSTHASDTTQVHGIVDTSLLLTTTHSDATTGVHGITDTSQLATLTDVSGAASDASTALGLHAADTTQVHGIADTSVLVTQTDLTNAITGATVDQSALAGTGIDWNSVDERFDIDNTIATKTYADNAVSTHNDDQTNVHGIADTSALALTADVNTALALKQDKVTGVSDTEIGYLDGVTSGIQGQLDAKYSSASASTDLALKAPLASPALTGTPTAPTATAGTNTTQIATTEFVTGAVADLIASAPGALNTLDELAAALGDDANFATTVTNSLATKAPLASPTFTGTVTLPAEGIVFSDGTQSKEGVPSRTPIVQKTASYTLSALTERDSMIEVDSTSATTISIPTDATLNYPVGTTIDILQTNTGQVTIAAATPATTTVNATPGLKLRTRWSSATLFKRAANTWVVYGDLTA